MQKSIEHVEKIQLEAERLKFRLAVFATLEDNLNELSHELDDCIGKLVDLGGNNEQIEKLSLIYDKMVNLF